MSVETVETKIHESYDDFRKAMEAHDCGDVGWLPQDDFVKHLVGFQCGCGEYHQLPLYALKAYMEDTGDKLLETAKGRVRFASSMNLRKQSKGVDGTMDLVRLWWPNVTVNHRVLHETARLTDVGFHAKWDEGTGLLVCVVERSHCPSDVDRVEIVKTTLGDVLNVKLKDGPKEG